MDNSYTQTVNFVAKPGSKYLKDFLPEGRLPKNCLFDKALTGCGGTYLALTDPEPYIIAVPTKSLVRDKVNGPQHREFNVQGVSSDYPLKNRELSVYSKIIVTYKSLPALANRLDISKYHLLVDEAQVKAALSRYESLKQEHREGKPVLLLLKGVLDQLLRQSFVLVHESSEEFEDLVYAVEVSPSEWPELSYYGYAKTLAQQTYDLFHEEMYVLTKEHKRSHIPTRTLASEVGIAPALSDSDKKLFKMKRDGLQPVCELYRKDKVKCQLEYPEWFLVVDTLGLDLCKSYDYSKKDLKAIYEATQSNLNPSIEDVVDRTFHVGCTYSISYIKTVLEDAGYQKPKGTSLNRWFQTKRVVSKGVSCYKIIQKLPTKTHS